MADASYTWSDFKERVTRLNDTDPDYEERFNDTHLPHRLVVNGIWELPFGRDAAVRAAMRTRSSTASSATGASRSSTTGSRAART